MKRSKKLVSLILSLALLLGVFAGMSVSTVSADSGPNTKYSSEEVILHCWNWPVSVIRSKLYQIAEAGYTAIQTSPINGIVGSGNNTADNTVTNWYQFYQPTNYNIGNKICTEAEFKTLCTEAHELGLKVIVDVALNHTSDQTGSVDSALKNYHGHGEISNWDDRWQQTQMNITGMPDLNTNNTTIQSKARTMLQKILSDGADGFRFDAAKHIELPSGDEINGCPTSDYWPNVLNNLSGDKFSYGEVLAGQNCPLYSYSKYMNVTGSAYSDAVRNNIQNNELKASDLSDYKAGLGGNNLVCWVESHDNYKGGNYGMPNYQVKLAWAAITAQGLNTLYLARPYGATTSNWKGTDNTYDGGDGAYFDKEIVEVNKFHNAAKGQSVNVYNVNGNTTLFAVARGNIGICLINTSENSQYVSGIGVSLPNGSYKTACGSTFDVNNGSLSGTIPGRSVACVYRGGTTADTECYLLGSFNAWTKTSGAQMTKDGSSFTKTINLSAGTYEFKINDTNNNWYGNSGTIEDTTYKTSQTGWDMDVDPNAPDCKLKASGGSYTFSFNTSDKKLIVSYEPGATESTSETETETSTSGNTDTNVYLDFTGFDVANANWNAWTWGTTSGKWVQGTKSGTTATFEGLEANVIFVRMDPSYSSPDWKAEWNRTSELTTQLGKIYKITAWNDGTEGNPLVGQWVTPATQPASETETETSTSLFTKTMYVDTANVIGTGFGSHWFAWTWGDGVTGQWRSIEKFNYVSVSDNVLFANFDTDTPSWNDVLAQTADFVVQDGKKLTILNTKDSNNHYQGEWETDPTDTDPTETQTETTDEPIPDVKGDADGNGVVTIDDVTVAQRALIGLETLTDARKQLLDINGDKKFTLRDVTLIQMYLAKMIETL